MQTYKTKMEQLEALRAPFALEDIRTREEGGNVLNYFESATIMRRLFSVMGGDYSLESGRIESYHADGKLRRIDMEVIVTLNWVDGTTSRLTGWGSSDVQYSRKDEWRIVSDFMKSALTDGTKVALSKIGVGAELYDSQYRKKLETDKAEAAQAAREKAMFTCQNCQGEITGGKVGTKDLTREEVVTHTRTKFKKRLCIDCGKAAASGGGK